MEENLELGGEAVTPELHTDREQQTTSKKNRKKTKFEAWKPKVVIPVEREKVEVSIKTLLDAGAHYGHQSQRWNPKMLPYIHGERNGVHIINLDQTLRAFEKAKKFISDKVRLGGTVLFVGTKQQAKDTVEQEAVRSGSYYTTHRWLGGALTNFETLKGSINRMKKLETLLASAADETSDVRLSKKERLSISRQLERFEATLSGIRNMRRHPDVVILFDINKDDIAVTEAVKLNIPIIALCDTNTDPRAVDFPIPSNDDATKTLQLFASAFADTIMEARAMHEARSRAKGENGKGQSKFEESTQEAAQV